MSRKGFSFLIVLALIAGVSESTATTVQRFTLEEMTARSQTIVHGVVRGARSYWSPDRKLILTDTTLEVAESLKGQNARTIEVTTVGGQIGDAVLHVSGMPAFRPGENAIVFIERSGGYLTVVGLGQGKFSIVGGDAMNAVSDLNFADGRASRPVNLPVQTLKNTIRALVERPR